MNTNSEQPVDWTTTDALSKSKTVLTSMYLKHLAKQIGGFEGLKTISYLTVIENRCCICPAKIYRGEDYFILISRLPLQRAIENNWGNEIFLENVKLAWIIALENTKCRSHTNTDTNELAWSAKRWTISAPLNS